MNSDNLDELIKIIYKQREQLQKRSPITDKIYNMSIILKERDAIIDHLYRRIDELENRVSEYRQKEINELRRLKIE
jgi:hypothetical protein